MHSDGGTQLIESESDEDHDGMHHDENDAGINFATVLSHHDHDEDEDDAGTHIATVLSIVHPEPEANDDRENGFGTISAETTSATNLARAMVRPRCSAVLTVHVVYIVKTYHLRPAYRCCKTNCQIPRCQIKTTWRCDASFSNYICVFRVCE